MERTWDGVFLDLGGVVLDLTSVQRARELFLDRLEERFELAAADPDATWKRELGDYFREREGTAFRPAREGYQRAVDEILAGDVAADTWWPLFVETAGESFEPVEGAPETVRALDEAGHYVGLVSDIDAWEAEFVLQSFGLRECFDDLTTSEEVGVTKPDPAIFEAAIEKAGVDPGRSLYVGDRYVNDMEGGTRAGFRTVAVGEAASKVAVPPDGVSVDDPAVDFALEDLRDLLIVVGLED